VPTLSLKVPEALNAKLREVARQRKASKSAVVREALAQFLTQSDSTSSFLALAHDLAGSIEGPKDLSFNQKYFRGYGQ
jgi:metal-responsive CopG/Arc/MetJ family transcriptional regulator